jgi:hypothetical protein
LLRCLSTRDCLTIAGKEGFDYLVRDPGAAKGYYPPARARQQYRGAAVLCAAASLKKIAMGAGPFKSHMIFFEGVDQNPIRLKVAVSATRELSSQSVIFQFRR